MPYTSSTEYRNPCVVAFENCWNAGGGQSACQYPAPQSFTGAFIKNHFSRTGTNAPGGIRGKAVASPGGAYIVVTRKQCGNKRLAYKVFNPLIGKDIWARDCVYTTRLIRKKSKRGKRRKLPKKFFVNPNPLNFTLIKRSFSGDSVVKGTYIGDPLWYRKVAGPLWAPFVPFGAPVPAQPNPQNYFGFSQEYTAAAAELETKLLSKFYERVKNQAVNLAQALGERKQTSKMLSDAVVRLASGVKLAKQGNLRAAAGKIFPKNSKDLANDWLLYQYGVKPLLSDIDGAAKHLALGEKVIYNVTVKRKVEIPSHVLYNGGTNNNFKCTTVITSSGFVEVSYKARIQVDKSFQRDLERFGFTDPLAVAWELMPWSFVADWFIPIGDYLGNQDAFDNVQLLYCTKTVVMSEDVFCTSSIGGIDNNWYNWDQASASWSSKRFDVVRSILTNNLPPLPKPQFKDPVSDTHLANAVALLRQLRK